MSFLIKGLALFGALLLAHGIYSAYEHSLLPARTSIASQSSTATAARQPLPVDITIETLLGSAILLFTIVFSSSPLRPIQWAEWAGKIEREGWDPNAVGGHDVSSRAGKGGKGNPYRGLEERRGFWDVRIGSKLTSSSQAARQDFANWVREDGQASGKKP